MSSVNSSDGSNRQDDVVRRNREEYREKESELIKKHNREIRRIGEVHNQQLESVKSTHQKQMDELKSKSHNSINSRDHRHQTEINNLRDMQRKQLEQLASESQSKLNQARQNTAQQQMDLKRRYETQIEDLRSGHQRELTQQNESYQMALEDNREKVQSSIGNYRERMGKKHSEDIQTINDNRMNQVSELQRKYDEHRRSSDYRLRNQEVRHLQDKQRMSENNLNQLKRQRSEQEDQAQVLRTGFEDGLAKTRERFEKANEKERSAREENGEVFKSSVSERVDSRMRALESRIEDLKALKVRRDLELTRDKNREVTNVKDSYQNNIDDLEYQRKELLRASNAKNAKEIQKIHGEKSELMQNQNRFFNEKISFDRERSKEQVQNLKSDFESRSQQTQMQADNRVNTLLSSTELEMNRVQENSLMTAKMMKEQHQEELKVVRAQVEAEKAEAIERLKDQLRKREMQQQEKMNSVVTSYEKQLAQLNDDMVRLKRSQDVELKRMVDNMKRVHQSELDTQQVQYQNRLSKVQGQHADEMRSVNERNQARMDQVLTTVKKA